MVAESSFPCSGPPAVIVHGIKPIRHKNPLIGELVGGTGMFHLKPPFRFSLEPIEAGMDCGAVTALQDQHIYLPPDQVSAQHRVYGVVLRTFLQGRGKLRVRHGRTHPERFHLITRNRQARPPIPRSQCYWFNHLADMYACPNSMVTAPLDPVCAQRVK
jgi:hypothetical protein